MKLASEGYDVTIADLPVMKDEAIKTANELEEKTGQKSHVVLADVSKRDNVEKMVASHVEHLGPLFTM